MHFSKELQFLVNQERNYVLDGEIKSEAVLISDASIDDARFDLVKLVFSGFELVYCSGSAEAVLMPGNDTVYVIDKLNYNYNRWVCLDYSKYCVVFDYDDLQCISKSSSAIQAFLSYFKLHDIMESLLDGADTSKKVGYIMELLHEELSSGMAFIDIGGGDGDLNFSLHTALGDQYFNFEPSHFDGYSLGAKVDAFIDKYRIRSKKVILNLRNSIHHFEDIFYLSLYIYKFKPEVVLITDYLYSFESTLKAVCYHIKFREWFRLPMVAEIDKYLSYYLLSYRNVNDYGPSNVKYITSYSESLFGGELFLDDRALIFSPKLVKSNNIVQDHFDLDYNYTFIMGKSDAYTRDNPYCLLLDYFFGDIRFSARYLEYRTFNSVYQSDDFDICTSYDDFLLMYKEIISRCREVRRNIITSYDRVFFEDKSCVFDPYCGYGDRLLFTMLWCNNKTINYYIDDINPELVSRHFDMYSFVVDRVLSKIKLMKYTGLESSINYILCSPPYGGYESTDVLLDKETNKLDAKSFFDDVFVSRMVFLYNKFRCMIYALFDNYKDLNLLNVCMGKLNIVVKFKVVMCYGYINTYVTLYKFVRAGCFEIKQFGAPPVKILADNYDMMGRWNGNVYITRSQIGGHWLEHRFKGLYYDVLADGVNGCGHHFPGKVSPTNYKNKQGQFKLGILLMTLLYKIRPSVVVYLGSGNVNSVVTNMLIKKTSKHIKYLLVDSEASRTVAKNVNIKCYDGYINFDTVDEIYAIYRQFQTYHDKVLVISDIRRGKNSITRGAEQDEENLWVKALHDRIKSNSDDVISCLKYNFTKDYTNLYNGEFVFQYFNQGELRLLTNFNSYVNVKWDDYDKTIALDQSNNQLVKVDGYCKNCLMYTQLVRFMNEN